MRRCPSRNSRVFLFLLSFVRFTFSLSLSFSPTTTTTGPASLAPFPLSPTQRPSLSPLTRTTPLPSTTLLFLFRSAMLTLATLALLAATTLPVEALSYHSNNPRNHIHHHHAQLERQKRTLEQNMGKKMARKMKRADAGAFLPFPLSLCVYTTTGELEDARGQRVFVCSGCCGRGVVEGLCGQFTTSFSLVRPGEEASTVYREGDTSRRWPSTGATSSGGDRSAQTKVALLLVARVVVVSFFSPSLLAENGRRVQALDDGDDGDVGKMQRCKASSMGGKGSTAGPFSFRANGERTKGRVELEGDSATTTTTTNRTTVLTFPSQHRRSTPRRPLFLFFLRRRRRHLDQVEEQVRRYLVQHHRHLLRRGRMGRCLRRDPRSVRLHRRSPVEPLP
jgi:hypothetical protein